MKTKILFIVNPISGGGKKGNIPALIEKNIDKDLFDYKISLTEYRKHAKQLAYQSALEGYDVVCAVGGDGSVHEVGTALIGTPTKLAIIPIGSGNGLARHLRIPMNIEKAIQNINQMNVMKMDTVLVNDKPFLNAGGYGFDALIAKKFNSLHKRGFMNYIKLVLREFMRYNPVNVTVDINGEVKQLPVMLCSIMNASEFGNGFCVSPKSDVTDGKIELCLLKPFSLWSAPRLAYQFFSKQCDRSRFSEIISFEKARITLSEKVAHYDGEPFDVRSVLNVQVVPQSLNILVGK
jgi:YegS/Rv2252/BmrU family lipid kinase